MAIKTANDEKLKGLCSTTAASKYTYATFFSTFYISPFLGALGIIRVARFWISRKQGSGCKMVSSDLKWCGTQPPETFIKRKFQTDDVNAIII